MLNMSALYAIVSAYGPAFMSALAYTLAVTFASYGIGLALGLPISLGRLYGREPWKAVPSAYVEVIRGTPLVVQLFIVYYALPQVGIKLDALTASVIAFGLNSAAYQAEYWRAALNSVPRTQWESALSLGLSRWGALHKVIIPQAWRAVMPALTNELVYLLKYSSLAAFVTLPELVYTGNIIAAKTFMYVEVYTIIAVIYIILAMAISEGLGLVEKRQRIPGLGTRIRV